MNGYVRDLSVLSSVVCQGEPGRLHHHTISHGVDYRTDACQICTRKCNPYCGVLATVTV